MTLPKRCLTIVVAVVLGASVSGAVGRQGALPPNPRDLPSLRQHWTWKGPAAGALVADGVVYVRGDGRLTAIEARNGKVLWDTVCIRGQDLSGEGPVVVGGNLALSFGDKLFLVDRRTGALRKTLVLGVVQRITAPPLLVVAAGRKDRVDLVRIDAASGEVVARREVGGIVYDLEMAGNLAVAIVDRVSPGAEGSNEMLAAYSADGLDEAWRIAFDGFPELEWIGDSLYAADVEGEGDDSRAVHRRVDRESGQLGPALPQRVANNVSGGLTWELEIVALKEGQSPARLRRNSVEIGGPIWVADLPGVPHGWVRNGDRLYLHCDHEGGRGYLVVLDWATGAVKDAAYGLRDVRGLFSDGDAIIAWQDAGLTAFSALVFGAPEKLSRSVRDEVGEILRGVTHGDIPLDRREHVQAAVTDLKALGRQALPFVAEQVPGLTAPALVAAARVLGDGRYREAGRLLAARLPELPPPPRTDWDRWDPAVDVLNALSHIGGDGEVGAVAAILDDDARDGATRRQALATLASIGTPRATVLILKVLARRPVPEPWWRPASPQEFLEFVGRTDLEALEEAAREGQDWDRMLKIDRAAGSARVPLPGGSALLVFHDSRLGGHKDLWVADVDATGRLLSPARFVGASVDGSIRASVDGDALVIERTAASGPLRVERRDLQMDSDGDGLPDLVELRLKTRPDDRDTDGDGHLDFEDAAPNGAGAPRTEEQEIIAAVFQQFFMFETDAGPPGPAIVVGDSALQWTGRRGPTITLTRSQNDQFMEESGSDGIPHIFIEPGTQEAGRVGDDPEAAPLGPDERHYKVTIYRGPLNAVGYDVTVRKRGRQWLVRECRFVWVS